MSKTESSIPFVDLWAQHEPIMPQMQAALEKITRQSSFIYGSQLEEFEKAFAAYHQIPYALGCASGTDALILAARALDLKPGDEVISVANTWIATIFAVSFTGATPVLVDVNPETRQIDIQAVKRAITPRTKAVFAVHMFGHPADLTALDKLCRANNIALVEDVAQATGAKFDGKLCGTVGDMGCFSFYPSKNLGCLGDGGAVLSKNETRDRRLRRLANYGQDVRFTHEEPGYNSRLDTLQAAFLQLKLPYLAQWNNERRRLAKRYDKLLEDLPVVTPYEHPSAEAVYHLYVIELDNRDACHAFMREHGVMVQVHYPNMVHVQPCYKELGYKHGDLPVTERLCSRILSLPIYPGLTEAQQDRVVTTLRQFLSR